MFEDSLLESGNRFKSGRRELTTLLSLVLQGVLVGVLILLPLIYTEALPKQQLMMFIVAPPPPPPPPLGHAAVPRVARQVETNVISGKLRTPAKILKAVEVAHVETPSPGAGSAGVPGGVPGGVAGGVLGGVSGGQLGGVVGGIVSSVPVALPKVALPKVVTPQPLRVSQGVQESKLEHKVMPVYPLPARLVRVQGTVILEAVISKTGSVENLRVLQGHPMLAPAAVEAVKQWKYKPTYLNGEPVEVETVIRVNFTLAGG